MKKIPTLFRRDFEHDPKHVTREPNPECAWVFAGEGRPTRKYDGTCVMYDGSRWWARREVKPGKAEPPGFELIGEDETTGKRMGWEPVEQSGFAKFHAEALSAGIAVPPEAGATYELVGPRINRNPEQADRHLLVRHGHSAPADKPGLQAVPRDYDGLRSWLAAHPGWEGIVWHHPDGRMAKIKARDFPAGAAGS